MSVGIRALDAFVEEDVCEWDVDFFSCEMMKRVCNSELDCLSVRSRLTLFHKTTVTASAAVAFEEDEINYDVLLSSGTKAVNIIASGISPTQLKSRGFESSSQYRHFGFDALHLVNSSFCNKMILAYGRDDVVSNFLASPQDAVSLAGSPAVAILKISSKELLEKCIGFPTHSVSVLKQLPAGAALHGVPASLLLDCGLRLPTLSKLGYSLDTIIKSTDASTEQLQKLGFSMA